VRVLASAAAGVTALLLAGCTGGGSGGGSGGAQPQASSPARTTTAAPPTAAPTSPAGKPVHVTTFEGDGKTYGVGMPVIAYFSRKVTDASAFEKAVTVTVDGKKADGAWYWEASQRDQYALEAHYRLRDYWPAHATITVDMPLKGVSAGPGLTFSNDLALTMSTGAAQVSEVDGTPGVDTMTITSDGQPVRTLKVSLGAAKTPTYLGTAVVMAKSNPEEMKSDPGEQPAYDLLVPWSVRVTNSGEFIHDAYWNGHLGTENLSHGCTNLSPADAEWYYGFAQIGDPVTWTNTGTGTVIPVEDGWGDWNLDWATWSQGGLVPTTGG
jgi:lipoprotein-anchoring transpeptidase ErfK/SrfK